jgi:hypothetical protein
MSTFPRLFLLFGVALCSEATFALGADNKAVPIPVAAPAFVNVVTFSLYGAGENHKIVVDQSPGLLRVDEPNDGYSVIYDSQTQHYTGLEHRNYTYWEFSWPEVRAAVEKSKRYEARLQDLSSEGFNGDNPPPTPTPNTNAPAGGDSSSSAGDSDDSGYVWRPTTDRQRIAGLDCVRWTGDTVSGESVDAWCYAGPLPQVRAAMESLRAINEPMALVPVREIVPDFVFTVFDGLTRGGVTPLLITWGGSQDKNRFAFVESKTVHGKLSLFTVPKLYIKTTLITMDGIINQKK